MATRSRIGIVNKDGSIRSIYCHWDGYPEGVGSILHKNYQDRDKVEELISLGSISSLGDSIHTTISYVKNFGEKMKDNAPMEHRHFQSFKKYFQSSDQQWAYLFDPDGKWVTYRSSI